MEGAAARRLVAVNGVELQVERVLYEDKDDQAKEAASSSKERVPVVFLHGLFNCMDILDEGEVFSARLWQQVEGVECIRYDARGHGGSQGTFRPEDYKWENLARDCLALTTEIGIEQFVCGGMSMGCATSIYAALQAPERVLGLILVIPPTAWETRDATQRGKMVRGAELIEEKGLDEYLSTFADKPSLEIFRAAGVQYNKISAKHLAEFRCLREGGTANEGTTRKTVLSNILRGAALCDLPSLDEIKAILAPTLILAWGEDPVHPLSTAKKLHDAIGGSRLHVASTYQEVKAEWPLMIADFVQQLRRRVPPNSTAASLSSKV